MVKNITDAGAWVIFDAMRGIVTDGNDPYLRPDSSNAESSTTNFIDVTPTGFKISNLGGTQTFIFIAIRRPDGYCGKPPELGTGVFAMDTGNGQGNTTPPEITSGFPVDFAFYKRPATSDEWITSARLIQGKYLQTQTNSAEVSNSAMSFDNNTGWDSDNLGSNYQSWMWKRHAGFDVVTYKGNGTAGYAIPHSLSKTPEMIWVKKRSALEKWMVGHKGLNGGVDPWGEFISLNETNAEVDSVNFWNDTAPTATHFTLGLGNYGNTNNETFIAMLFASVDGISKVGYYSGVQDAAVTVTTGFSPRFIIVKARNYGSSIYDWFVFDTVRGFGSGDDKYLRLNDNTAQGTTDVGTVSSTGFTLNEGAGWNMNNREYIYYAHA